jgi:hypothetical protein
VPLLLRFSLLLLFCRFFGGGAGKIGRQEEEEAVEAAFKFFDDRPWMIPSIVTSA